MQIGERNNSRYGLRGKNITMPEHYGTLRYTPVTITLILGHSFLCFSCCVLFLRIYDIKEYLSQICYYCLGGRIVTFLSASSLRFLFCTACACHFLCFVREVLDSGFEESTEIFVTFLSKSRFEGL